MQWFHLIIIENGETGECTLYNHQVHHDPTFKKVNFSF